MARIKQWRPAKQHTLRAACLPMHRLSIYLHLPTDINILTFYKDRMQIYSNLRCSMYAHTFTLNQVLPNIFSMNKKIIEYQIYMRKSSEILCYGRAIWALSNSPTCHIG